MVAAVPGSKSDGEVHAASLRTLQDHPIIPTFALHLQRQACADTLFGQYLALLLELCGRSLAGGSPRDVVHNEAAAVAVSCKSAAQYTGL